MSRRNKKGRDINGVLLLDKASGCSSNSALQDVKYLFNANKAGHTGSLDPLASGLLPICFGQATKIAQFLLDGDKRYFVRGKLGLVSNTGDSEGELSEYGSTKDVDDATIKSTLLNLIGNIKQIPPMYSALKREGTPLYKLARKGIEVEREAREVSIHEILFKDFDADILTLEVSCSKGTYIRTLIEDIGKLLGCGGYVIELRRIGFAHFDIAQGKTFEELQLFTGEAYNLRVMVKNTLHSIVDPQYHETWLTDYTLNRASGTLDEFIGISPYQRASGIDGFTVETQDLALSLEIDVRRMVVNG